jgi:hypothetical protein
MIYRIRLYQQQKMLPSFLVSFDSFAGKMLTNTLSYQP